MPRGREYREVSYYTKDWFKLRAKQLKYQPWCVYCAKSGREERATHADHIRPHRGNPELFFDETNLQSLCATCSNSVKQAEEIAGGPIGCGIDGWPRDDQHPVYGNEQSKTKQTSQSIGHSVAERKKPR